MKNIILIISVLIVVAVAGCIKDEVEINNFEDCVNAGYPVMESYPRQCRTPDDQTFVEVIEDVTPVDPIIGGETDEHGCVLPAGYIWCESKQKCLRTWEEECNVDAMNEKLCDSARGNWNECSNKCRLDNQGKPNAICTLQCESLCECGGIAGFGCPNGYDCIMPERIADALGYCMPERGKTVETTIGKRVMA